MMARNGVTSPRRKIWIGFDMENYKVYMHVNKINGKRYIGITSQNPASRWKNGEGYKKQRRFYSAIVCYGWENFDHLILHDGLTKAEAEVKEAELISEYKSNEADYGYNIENGGVTHKISESQKEHLRRMNIGKHHSEETKKKMSIVHRGMSSAWLTGRQASAETKAKMSESRSGKRNPRAKAVWQYDLNGNVIAQYNCMAEVKEALALKSTSHISRCCSGTRKKAYGYMWSYSLKELSPYERQWRGGVVHG